MTSELTALGDGVYSFGEAPRRPRTALIIGAAMEVLQDLENAQEFGPFDEIIAVNDAGWIIEGPIDHWVTLHWERMAEWLLKREGSGGEGGFRTWTRDHPRVAENPPPPDELHPHWGKGTSALYAVAIAQERLDCERIVLCGVPMTPTEHFLGHVWPKSECYLHREGWEYHFHRRLKGKVKSMSGWTRALLGAPAV